MNRKTAGAIQLLLGMVFGTLAAWRIRALEVAAWHDGTDAQIVLGQIFLGAAVALALCGALFLLDGAWRDLRVKRFFPGDALAAIARKVAEVEGATAGEVRVVVRIRRSLGEWRRGQGVEEMALAEFRRLNMSQTRDRTGVVVFLLLSRRRFRILGDTGIHQKIGQATWDAMAETISRRAADEGIAAAILSGLGEIGALLSKHFPRKADDVNELADEVAIR